MKEKQKAGLDSYIIIGVTFIVSVLIILLIYDSNNELLRAKINNSRAAISNPAQDNEQPSMDVMQQIQKLKNELAQNPQDFDLNVNLANAYFDISRFDKAALYYNYAIDQNRENPNILIDLSVSYFNLNKADSALIFITEALKLNPDHLFGLYNAGIIYYNTQRVEEAITVWKRLISVHPGTREAEAAREFLQKIETEKIKS